MLKTVEQSSNFALKSVLLSGWCSSISSHFISSFSPHQKPSPYVCVQSFPFLISGILHFELRLVKNESHWYSYQYVKMDYILTR
jgi:hypothetical protein